MGLLGGGDTEEILSKTRFIHQLLLETNTNNLNALFNVVYKTNQWGNGSGSGSDENLCANYVAYLQDFFRTHHIKSVVDVGCGDWQFSKNIDFSGIEYKGFDVASVVINSNNAKYHKQNITFTHYNGDFNVLPSADLLLCKDVLQHLPNAKIKEFLTILPRYKFALITNDLGENPNMEILPTQWRTLDLSLPPFNLKCKKVFEFDEPHRNECKITILWENPK
ncbi:methyltransferase [Helicobacter fennelliae]|uniref:methyltransferase n=1 Tax=Helicobacter fennelliae TaxID=215 RepID=UPI000E0EF2C5|nr:class I SAM-dependent methyltransferase [Helicobacter fennelliae]